MKNEPAQPSAESLLICCFTKSLATKVGDLAIRVDGHSYFVGGVNPDSLGDAHAKDGICESIRKARVTGEVKNGRFVATSFQLLPVASP